MTDSEKIAYLMNQFNELNDRVNNLSGSGPGGPVALLTKHVLDYERDITSRVDALQKLVYMQEKEGWFKRAVRRWLEIKAEREYR